MLLILLILLLSKEKKVELEISTKLASVIALLYNNRIIISYDNDYNVVFYLRGYLRIWIPYYNFNIL